MTSTSLPRQQPKLPSQIGKHIEGTAKAKNDLYSSENVRAFVKALTKYLDEKIKTEEIKALSTSTYDSPNWALLQADKNGYNRALNDLIKLLS